MKIYPSVFLRSALFAAAIGLLSGCAVTVLQPYDEKLIDDTEAIFKNASAIIDDGINVSPKTDAERQAIPNKEAHAGHASKFNAKYDALSTDADALILRALSKSGSIDKLGNDVQKKITDLIDKELPSNCSDIEADLGVTTESLTVKNYIDLKCLLIGWKHQHSDDVLTDNAKILKKSNWETRKSTIFSAILAIEKAELSKQK